MGRKTAPLVSTERQIDNGRYRLTIPVHMSNILFNV